MAGGGGAGGGGAAAGGGGAGAGNSCTKEAVDTVSTSLQLYMGMLMEELALESLFLPFRVSVQFIKSENCLREASTPTCERCWKLSGSEISRWGLF